LPQRVFAGVGDVAVVVGVHAGHAVAQVPGVADRASAVCFRDGRAVGVVGVGRIVGVDGGVSLPSDGRGRRTCT
jgi:hypothetical protein